MKVITALSIGKQPTSKEMEWRTTNLLGFDVPADMYMFVHVHVCSSRISL